MRAALFAGLLLLFVVLVLGVGLWLIRTLFGEHGFGLIAALLLLILGVLVGRAVIRGVRRTAGPLGELIEASARVEAGDYGGQVAERGPREVRALARAFNAMSTRLAHTDAQRRQLLADVSHELRTPLTVIQGNVEGMLDGVYPPERDLLERILAETRQLERLIEDLRTMSLADAGSLPLHRESTDLGALVTDAIASLQPQAAEAGVEVSSSAHSLPEIDVDPRRIRQVIANLVSNSLRHTPRGGSVTVSVAASDEDLLLTVADTGSGMDAESAARAFDRFWKAPGSPGAGLGLPIARDLVEAHGGSIEIESAAGQGTSVRVRLPASAA